MNNWGPVMLRGRRGRSGSGFAYPREALGPPIRSKRPYLFADALLNQNQLILWLEDRDPFYRGEITLAGLAEAEPDLGCGSDSSESSEAPSSAPSSPLSPESEEPTSPIDRESHPFERMSSPLTPARSHSRSPTMTELFGPSSSAPSGRAVVTYLKRDRERARILAHEQLRNTQAEETANRMTANTTKAKIAAKKLSAKNEEAARRKSAALLPPRHSRRNRRGRVGDSSEYGVADVQGLLASGYDLHKLYDK
ncbi:hypothetical protein B0H14DRAFT_3433244 [Mycena olivaceomarginata]|nr:hypothetical protein B0H14DRAFT_3433244 [Mycena olivaceomarginata]